MLKTLKGWTKSRKYFDAGDIQELSIANVSKIPSIVLKIILFDVIFCHFEIFSTENISMHY